MMTVATWGNLLKIPLEGKLREITSAAKRLSEISIVVDKMHMKGHVDRWCKENCDARNIEELREVSIVDKAHFLKNAHSDKMTGRCH